MSDDGDLSWSWPLRPEDYTFAQTAIEYLYNCILESGINIGALDVLETLFTEAERIPGENSLKLAHGMLLVAYTLVKTRQLEQNMSPQQTIEYLRDVYTAGLGSR